MGYALRMLTATALVEGHPELADWLFLIAFVLGLVGAVVYAMARAVAPALVAGAVALVALGLLVL